MRLKADVKTYTMKYISTLILLGFSILSIAWFNSFNQEYESHYANLKKEIQAPSNCPAAPEPLQITQANGQSITIVGKGNMNNSWTETIDGYTIIPVNGNYEYAQKINGDLQPTGISVHDPLNRTANEINYLANIQKSIQPDFNPLKNSILDQVNSHLSNKTYPTSGNLRILAILIDYPDLQSTYNKSNFDSLLYGANYRSGDGSFKTFYETASNGSVTINVDVMGWYRAANGYLYYGRDSGYSRAADLAREAVVAADVAGANFANYDNDNDGDVDGILVVHAGPGAEQGSRTQYIWSHRWVLAGANQGAISLDGKFINDYMMNPETRIAGANQNMVGIGVFCHEFGHNLGLPDLYDTDASNGDSEGIGNWCLMAGGGWMGGEHRPVNFSAWCRVENGWDTPRVLTIGSSSADSLDVASTSNNEIIRVNTPISNEYFLLENRQKTGLDLELPGTGLAIWHINTTKTNTSGNSVNADENLKGVDLEEADGNNDLDNEVNRGDNGDLFPGSTNNTTFDDNSNPNARNYNLAATSLQIRNISENSGKIFFDFGPQPSSANCSGGTTTLTGTTGSFSDGSGASNYANNLSCSWLIQPTGVSTITLRFTSLATEINNDVIRIYDGINNSAPLLGSYSGTNNLNTITSTGGVMFVEFITNGSITDAGWDAVYTTSISGPGCSGSTTLTATNGSFSDGSGVNNYDNNQFCSWLIQPPSGTITLNFTAFSTEAGADRVLIFDGTDNTAPQIANYSGTSIPASVTSTSNALYLEFRTNGSVVDQGWDATYTTSSSITCSGTVNLTASSGTVSDGSGTSNYDPNLNCEWLIQPPGNPATITFTMNNLNLANFGDRVEVYDGTNSSGTLLMTYLGNNTRFPITAYSGAMFIRFMTDNTNQAQGWDGTYTSSATFCSPTTTYTANTGAITDGSPVGQNYANNTDCEWLIQPAATNVIIDLSFTRFSTQSGNDTVSIYDGSSTNDPKLGTFSGGSLPGILTSSGGSMLITFESDNSITDNGWRAVYTTRPRPACSGRTTFTAASGTFDDGSAVSANYVSNSNCEWLIQPPGAFTIDLNFNRFDTETNFDFVSVYDGTSTAGTLLGTFSGNSIPSQVTATSGSMLVVFTSDNFIQETGWEASYNSSNTAILDAIEDTVYINAASGSQTSFTLNSNTSWSTSDNAIWLISSPFNGNLNATVNLLALQPNIGPPRSAEVYISSTRTTIKDTVIVIQRGSGNYLDVTPDTLYFAAQPSSAQQISISSSVAWTITPSSTWITVNPLSGSTNGNPNVSPSINSSINDRLGFIVISGTGGVSNDTVYIKQTGTPPPPPSLSVSPQSITLSNSAGSSDIFTVNSTVQWQTSSGASWLQVTNPTNTFDTNTVMISTGSANMSPTPRMTYVAVQDIGGTLFDTVFVTQLGNTLSIVTNPDTVMLAATLGSSASGNIVANTNWTIAKGANWFDATPISGTGNDNLTFTANSDNNTGAQRVSFVSYEDAANNLFDTVVVIQNALPTASFLNANPRFITLSNLIGSTGIITVNSNVTWQVSSSVNWLNFSFNGPPVDTGGITIISNSANGSLAPRNGYIAIQDLGGTVFDTVFVTQLGVSPVIDVSPDTIRLAATNGSTANANAVSNSNWSSVDGASWLQSSPNSGTAGNTNITVTAQSANTSGSEKISFVAFTTLIGRDTLVVIQDFMTSGMLTTNPDTVYLNSTSNSTGSYNVIAGSNVNWSATAVDNWISLTNNNGTGNGTVIITANSANPSPNNRITYAITSGASLPIPDTVVVIQRGFSPSITISPSSLSLGSTSGSSGILNVNSNITWTVSNPVTWLNVTPNSGTNNGTVNVTANSDNLTGAARTATLDFSGSGGLSELVTVTQVDGSTPNFSLSEDTLWVNNPQGSTGTFFVQSNIQGWSLSETTSWILVNPTSGNNTETITVLAATRNNFGNPRYAEIIGSAPGFPDDTLIVAQRETTPLFQVAPSIIVLGSDSLDEAHFNISSNLIAWTITENSAWMTTSTTMGQFTQRITVTAIDSNNTGNVRSDSIIVSSPPLVPQIVRVIQDTAQVIGITENSEFLTVDLYPNPNNGQFIIEGIEMNKNLQIRVFDIIGKTIEYSVSNLSHQKAQFNLGDVPEGIYFVEIAIGDKRISRKISVINN